MATHKPTDQKQKKTALSAAPELAKPAGFVIRYPLLWLAAAAFINTYPKMEQYVAQKYIASYPGITPEFLSKIRGNLSRKSA